MGKFKRIFLSIVSFVALSATTFAATPLEIELWSNATAPHSNKLTTVEEESENGVVKGVTQAVLTLYEADRDRNTGQAVVICPGGGYGGVSMKYEGRLFAEWFAENGITAAVLKYRMPNGVKEVPYEDVERALQVMRQRSRQFGYDPRKVGIVGSSAGGHLAAWVSTTMPVEEKPNFTVLFYPVISSDIYVTHIWSFYNLMGKTHSELERHKLSADKLVDADTPPAIMILSNNDPAVAPENSIRYYQALKSHNITAAMNILPAGGHGWGASDRVSGELWKPQLMEWLDIVNKELDKKNNIK